MPAPTRLSRSRPRGNIRSPREPQTPVSSLPDPGATAAESLAGSRAVSARRDYFVFKTWSAVMMTLCAASGIVPSIPAESDNIEGPPLGSDVDYSHKGQVGEGAHVVEGGAGPAPQHSKPAMEGRAFV